MDVRERNLLLALSLQSIEKLPKPPKITEVPPTESLQDPPPPRTTLLLLDQRFHLVPILQVSISSHRTWYRSGKLALDSAEGFSPWCGNAPRNMKPLQRDGPLV